MRIAWPGPSGDTDFFSRPSAISLADFLESPGAGFVESVFTFADQRRDGGVVERLPDLLEEVRPDLEEDRDVDLVRDVRVLDAMMAASVTKCDAGQAVGALARRRRKKSVSMAPHSSARTPSITSTW